MPLADRVVLITGATDSLGRALVTTFAGEGCRLGLVGRTRPRGLERETRFELATFSLEG